MKANVDADTRKLDASASRFAEERTLASATQTLTLTLP